MTEHEVSETARAPLEVREAVIREATGLIRARRHEDAVGLLRSHLARFPADLEVDYLLGHAAYASGEDDLAFAAFTRCVRAEPGHALAQYGLGITLYRQQQYEAARKALEAARDADPELTRAREQLAKLDAEGHPGDGVTAPLGTKRVSETARAPLEVREAVIREATGLIRARRHEDAVGLLRSHLARFPADLEVDYLLGHAAYASGEDDLAFAAFTRCVRAEPGHALAQYGLGITLYRQQQYEAARKALEAARDADPELTRAREQLAKLDAEGHPGDGVTAPLGTKRVSETARAPLEVREAVIREATGLIRARRHEDAVGLLRSHLARFPADLEVDYLLGHAAYASGEDDLAFAAFTRCVRAEPGHALAQYGLGITLYRQQQYEAARKALEAARDADPELTRAREQLAKLDAEGHPGDGVTAPLGTKRAQGSSDEGDRHPVRLRVVEGPAEGREIMISQSPTSIGRGREADVQLHDDGDVSRRHAVFRFEGGDWRLEDDGSRNGTNVNGRRVQGARALRDGDEITMGSSILAVQLADEDAAPRVGPSPPPPARSTVPTRKTPVSDRTNGKKEPSPRQTPQEGDVDAPSYEITLRGPVITGRVDDVQLRDESKNLPFIAYSKKLDTQTVEVLSLRLIGNDGRAVAVELRGLIIAGSHPRKGDRVAVPERWKNGVLRVPRFQNLETGEIVEARDASALSKGLYVARVIGLVLFVLVVFALIALMATRNLPGVLDEVLNEP